MSIEGFTINNQVVKYDYDALDNKPTIPSAVTVDSALSDSSTNPVQNKIVTAAINELDGTLDAITTSEETYADPISQSSITKMSGKKIESTHNIGDKTGWSILYVQAPTTGTYRITLSVTNNQNGVHIYSSSSFSSSTWVAVATMETRAIWYADVEAGQYIAASCWYTDYTMDVQLSTGKEYDIPMIDTKIVAEENSFFATGWRSLPTDKFSRNGWQSYSSTDSRSYRVRYVDPLQFAYPVYIRAAEGFYFSGFLSNNTGLNSGCTIYYLPANTPIKVYVRRITENTSETADIATFAAALTVSTPLADINRFSTTFTDVSMFERVGVCGDSYAAGGGIISGIRPLTWGKNLERQAGITVDIYAKSGENVVQWVTDSTNGLPTLLAGDECGLYWMQHGINGTSTSTALGTAADMSASPHPNTFYGQYVEAIEQIQTTFPNARIVIATVTGSDYSLSETNYADANTAIAAIGEYCNIPVIDITEDDFFRSPWYADGMRSNHPTAMIAAGMAHAYRRLIAKCIMKNPSYFVNYGSTS